MIAYLYAVVVALAFMASLCGLVFLAVEGVYRWRDSLMDVCTETWSCPYCEVVGQTAASMVAATNRAAHFRVVHDRDELGRPRQPKPDPEAMP